MIEYKGHKLESRSLSSSFASTSGQPVYANSYYYTPNSGGTQVIYTRYNLTQPLFELCIDLGLDFFPTRSRPGLSLQELILKSWVEESP